MIISAGEALVDLVPDPVPGGGPMNTAVTCARLGVPTAFLGRVSTDAHGELIWRHLVASGVDLSVAQRGEEPTCVAEIEGDPPVFRFRGEGTADRMLTEVDLSPLGPGPHILHGGTLGIFREPGATILAEVMERHDGLVSLDPNVRPRIIGDDGRADWQRWFDRWLARTDVFRCSDDDLAWIAPGETPPAAARRLLSRGVGAVIVTSSGEVSAHTRAGVIRRPTRRVTVVDTVGAGDSFVGGVLARLHEHDVRTAAALDGLDADAWTSIIDFAAHVASITVSRKGADPPWRHELLD